MESSSFFARARFALYGAVAGAVTCSAVGIPVFGPSAAAARLEGSKSFAKDFMARHNIPTSTYRVFTANQYDEALQYVRTCGHRVVLKASGLAAGKGVLVPESLEDTEAGLRQILVDRAFGSAGTLPRRLIRLPLTSGTGQTVVIEEFLEGPELSVLAFSDGYTIVPLPAAQDHKRIGDGDVGPNTGGMGAYAPAPLATPELNNQIYTESLKPSIDAMRREGTSLDIWHLDKLLKQPLQGSHSSDCCSWASLSRPRDRKFSSTMSASETPKRRLSCFC